MSHMSSTNERHSEDELDAVWKALANSMRRRILDVLVAGPATTGELAAQFDELSRFAVMQHLGVLEKAELVTSQKQGRSRMHHLNPIPIQQISDRWISRYQRPLAEALIDLKISLESEPRHETGGLSGTQRNTNNNEGTGASA